ncbi:MAG: AbfB domain-containing protein [Chthoniobacterales bacterium]
MKLSYRYLLTILTVFLFVGNVHSQDKRVGIALQSEPGKNILVEKNEQAKLSDKGPTLFFLQKGLVDPSLVSFRYALNESYYLRHFNFVINLHKRPKPGTIFDADATFRMEKGTDNTVRFNSFNYPDRYLAVRSDGVLIVQANAPLDKSTFIIQDK